MAFSLSDAQHLSPKFADLLVRLAEEHTRAIAQCSQGGGNRNIECPPATCKKLWDIDNSAGQGSSKGSRGPEKIRTPSFDHGAKVEDASEPAAARSVIKRSVTSPDGMSPRPPTDSVPALMASQARVRQSVDFSAGRKPSILGDPLNPLSARLSICGDAQSAFPQRQCKRSVTWSSGAQGVVGGIGTADSLLNGNQGVPRHSVVSLTNGVTADEVGGIELLPVWQHTARVTFADMPRRASENQDSSRKTLRHGNAFKETLSTDYESEGVVFNLFNKQGVLVRFIRKRLVMRPGSRRHFLWSTGGVALIGYDVVTIPLQAFEPPDSAFSEFLAWLCTFYWTMDIMFSFFVGYQSSGVIEMRLPKIAGHYARTWLAFDLVIVAIDWAIRIVGAEISGNSSSFGYLRAGRIFRFMQILRLLRLLKVHNAMGHISERVRSEFWLVMMGIAKLILMILLASHLIACSWYAIGVTPGDGTKTWVKEYVENKTLIYRYATALHWSLTQFTPASMEVYPQNSGERVFAVVVLLIAMVTFSSFISSITNSMTQLRNLNRDRDEKLSVLRRYLMENRVSTLVMVRIWGCLTQAMDMRERRLHEKDVVILELLPCGLKSDLQEEIYAPVLDHHPLLHHYATIYPQLMQRMFNNAVEEVSFGLGKQVFSCAEKADRMFFVRCSMLTYTQADMDPTSICVGQWVTEPVLWIKWKHTGDLVANSHCELLALKAHYVHEALQASPEVTRYARRFAEYFAKYSDILTDIYADLENLENMVQKAFADDDAIDEENGSMDGNLDVVPARRVSNLSSIRRFGLKGLNSGSGNIVEGRRRSSLFSKASVFSKMSWSTKSNDVSALENHPESEHSENDSSSSSSGTDKGTSSKSGDDEEASPAAASDDTRDARGDSKQCEAGASQNEVTSIQELGDLVSTSTSEC